MKAVPKASRKSFKKLEGKLSSASWGAKSPPAPLTTVRGPSGAPHQNRHATPALSMGAVQWALPWGSAPPERVIGSDDNSHSHAFSASHTGSHLILPTTLEMGCFYPHVKNEETKTWRGAITFPRSCN